VGLVDHRGIDQFPYLAFKTVGLVKGLLISGNTGAYFLGVSAVGSSICRGSDACQDGVETGECGLRGRCGRCIMPTKGLVDIEAGEQELLQTLVREAGQIGIGGLGDVGDQLIETLPLGETQRVEPGPLQLILFLGPHHDLPKVLEVGIDAAFDLLEPAESVRVLDGFQALPQQCAQRCFLLLGGINVGVQPGGGIFTDEAAKI
jgi:hypothetical protein